MAFGSQSMKWMDKKINENKSDYLVIHNKIHPSNPSARQKIISKNFIKLPKQSIHEKFWWKENLKLDNTKKKLQKTLHKLLTSFCGK